MSLWIVVAIVFFVTNLRVAGARTADDPATEIANALIAGGAMVAVFFLLVFRMGKGQNWCRILLTVLGLLLGTVSLLGSLVGLFVDSAVTTAALVNTALSVAAITFMYTRAAGRYFAPAPQQPRPDAG